MRCLKHLAIIFAAAAACGALSATAEESGALLSSSPYRLSLANRKVFRLNAPETHAPAPAAEPHDDSPILEPLGDRPFAQLINAAAREAALDPALVHALIYVESRYNPAARSAKGAIGLMQLLPETAARYGVPNPARSPEANLRAGTRYLRDLLQLFDERIELALAAYNAGENAVQRYGHRIPPYRETRAYVPAVLEKYSEWKEPPVTVPVAAPAQARVRIKYLPGTTLNLDSLHSQVNR